MTAYHDLDSPQTMRSDAAAAGTRLPLTPPPTPARDGFTDLYSAFPTDRPKREVRVSEAAQRIANALHLHLD